MSDLQSTVALQRYLVVEEGHGILGYFELPDDECIRDEVRELMDSRYEDDCIVFLRDPDAASGASNGPNRAIFAYAIPDSVPHFDPDQMDFYLDYDCAADSAKLGDTKLYPRMEAFLRVDSYRREDGLIAIDAFPNDHEERAIDASGTAREVTARIAAAFPRLDAESCRLLARIARKKPQTFEGGGKQKRIADSLRALSSA